ncbi:MAG TPA: energy transducer TonB [Chitinophagaceae bacterium]|nr:energy transducer TonB [Chitinophagaceae bacterium]
MNAATILSSDALDIIFEHRNKQYGAYPLRRGYNRRLYQSLAVVMGIGLALVALNYFPFNPAPNDRAGLPPVVEDSVMLTAVDLPKDAPPLLPPPPPPAGIQAPVATVKDMVPVIVPDTEDADTLPTVDQLADHNPGPQTTAGATPAGDNAGSGPGVTGGTGQAPATPALAVEETNTVLEHAELMPEFPGGTAALLRFLGRNLQVPEETEEGRIKVPIKFVVDREGQLTDVEFLTPAAEPFKKEILRVIHKMPRWKPGRQNGRAVPVYFTIPIIFEMTGN